MYQTKKEIQEELRMVLPELIRQYHENCPPISERMTRSFGHSSEILGLVKQWLDHSRDLTTWEELNALSAWEGWLYVDAYSGSRGKTPGGVLIYKSACTLGHALDLLAASLSGFPWQKNSLLTTSLKLLQSRIN